MTARIAVFGAGATGARIVRMLVASPRVGAVDVRDPDPTRLRALAGSEAELARPTARAARERGEQERGTTSGQPVSAAIRSGKDPDAVGRAWASPCTRLLGNTVSFGQDLTVPDSADLVVVATPAGTQARLASDAVRAGAAVVTTTNEILETRDLLALDSQACQQGVPLVVGAGFMPGLTCLMARVGADGFDLVDEVHVAKAGTGGPACARQHHRALSSLAVDWRDGRWTRRPGGSGRELCWFPDPVAGRDCYRGALPDALLLVPAFSGVDRVTARMAATRRDRLTAPLPMMRRPHPEGGVGAVRVELRGRRGRERSVVVFGAQARPAEATAVVAASTALHVLAGSTEPGANGLASINDPESLLREVAARNLRPCRFEGFALSRDNPA